MMERTGPKVAWHGRSRWATISPIWLFMLAIAVLVILSMAALHLSGSRELWVGLLGGAWLCVWAGFAFWILRRGELRD